MKQPSKLFDRVLVLITLIIVITSFMGINYSDIASISWNLAGGVFRGLMNPDWGFLYDGSGEDLISLILLTLGIAFLGTFIGSLFALPLSFVAARNLYHGNSIIARIGKFILNVLRAFPELIYAIIFVKMVGPGPFAGVLAIGVHHIGMMGKLFAEEMEAVDEGPTEAMNSVGTTFWQTMFYARIPQLIPIYASHILNHFEIAVRSAATLGLVGAGGIGAPMIFAIQARNWGKVSIILIGVIVTVFVIDYITGILRKKLR